MGGSLDVLSQGPIDTEEEGEDGATAGGGTRLLAAVTRGPEGHEETGGTGSSRHIAALLMHNLGVQVCCACTRVWSDVGVGPDRVMRIAGSKLFIWLHLNGLLLEE